jgi:hypothetical protein
MSREQPAIQKNRHPVTSVSAGPHPVLNFHVAPCRPDILTGQVNGFIMVARRDR